MTNDNWLEIGKIVAPQGLDGEVRVYPSSDFPERFLEPGRRWLRRTGAGEPQPVELLGGRYIPGKGLYVLQLAGIEDRNQAEALAGAVLLVPETDRPVLEEDEYHVRDLLGLQVFNQLTGQFIGTVVDVIPAGNDLLEVKLKESPQAVAAAAEEDPPAPAGKKGKPKPKPAAPATVLIPFVKEIVPVVDLSAGRVEVAPPAGLLEVASG
ncbi:ribosome maturation factor RimM [Kamptonema formosum]|uniref:ribosome maturation factor RimM n=1 Tax=Kamptonema formosum TaxID=331992 RepID=UPI00034AEA22|nr:ribosome maturation factor RimM [Oscillatoria sp. PCC 10802]